MKKLIFLLALSFIGGQFSAQNPDVLAEKICNSIKQISSKDSSEIFQKQSEILANDLQETLKAKMSNMDTLNIQDHSNELNVFNYKLIRNLNNSCPDFVYKDYFFLPVTHVVDLDNVFSDEQFQVLRDKILEIRENKNIDILVMEVDDWFPMTNVSDYSFKILYHWNTEYNLEKGKMILVFSKNLREIRISTDETSSQILSDDFLTNTVGNQIIPQFRNGNYYQGIFDALTAINDKL